MSAWFLLISFLTADPAGALSLDKNLGRITDTCDSPKAARIVWIFKQWHLPPSENTFPKSSKALPQEENQTSIYKQLASWIESKQLQTLVAEGCSGEIDSTFSEKYNGWGYSDLKSKSETADYPKLLSHVPLKLEAKYTDSLRTLCGDDQGLIKEQNLAFSEARGSVGFLKRLIENEKKPEKARPYLDEAIRLFKLPKDITVANAILNIRAELKKTFEKIKSLAQKRDERFLDTLVTTTDPDVAVVIGGAHATDLKRIIEKRGLGCKVVEPKGYDEGSNPALDFSNL